MVCPYFEGEESISGTGLSRFQGFKGSRPKTPANVTQTGLEILPGTSQNGLKIHDPLMVDPQ